MDILMDDLLLEIFDYLDISTLKLTSLVCKR